MAGLEVDALSLLQSVVAANTLRAEAEVVHLQAVVRHSEALSVNTPLTSSTLGVGGAVARVVQVESSVALIAVASNEVEGVAVHVGPNTRTISQCLSLGTASEARAYLHALPLPHCVPFLLAAEAVS